MEAFAQFVLSLALLLLSESPRRLRAREAARRAEEGLREAEMAGGNAALLAYWKRELEEERKCARSFSLRGALGERR